MITRVQRNFFCFMTLTANIAAASVSINDSTSWQSPISEKSATGNAEVPEFSRATRKTRISDAELATVEAQLPETEMERWYAKVGYYKGSLTTGDIKNNSPKRSNFIRTDFGQIRTNGKKNAFIVGFGYNNNGLRFETEVLMGQKITPNITNNANIYKAKVASNCLLCSLCMDFKIREVFPFVGVILGVSANKTTFQQTQNSKSVNTTSYSLVNGLQAGVRTRLMNSNLFAGITYRYFDTGRAVYNNGADSETNTIKLRHTVKSKGLSLDLYYLLF
jgi:hypothetical protein